MKLLQQRFEKSFDSYDTHAVVQKIMAQKLAAAIPQRNYGTVLEIGAGTGLLTREIMPRIKFQHYIANDLCEKSRDYLPADVDFIAGDAREVNIDADLVVSNAVVQWLDGWLPQTSGLLAFSTFAPGNLHELKELTGIALDYKLPALAADTEILYREEFEHKLIFETPMELLAHLKHTGVNSLARWTFADVKDFCARCTTPELTYKPLLLITERK